MTATERRQQLITQLEQSASPITATQLARQYHVTRQIIVSDIALLRAAGHDILATTRGYLLNRHTPSASARYRAKIAFQHTAAEMEAEMRTILTYGGHIETLEVEHPVYGMITVNLNIRTLAELEAFLAQFQKRNTELLSSLTNGIHLHQISCDNNNQFEALLQALEQLNILLK